MPAYGDSVCEERPRTRNTTPVTGVTQRLLCHAIRVIPQWRLRYCVATVDGAFDIALLPCSTCMVTATLVAEVPGVVGVRPPDEKPK